MSSEPLASIVVPTFNRARLLPAAIESALNQSWRNLEVLVVDDGSTDHTAAVVDAMHRRDPRVRFIRQDHRGVSAARNRALAEARGEFIAFLDSDDAWLPWKLEVQLALLCARPDLVMTWTDMQAVGPDESVRHTAYLRRMYSAYAALPDGPFTRWERLGAIMPGVPDDLRSAFCGIGEIYVRMLSGNLVHTSTVVVRRDVVRTVGWFDESMQRGGEDFKFHLATCRCGPVALIDVPSIRYRIGEDDRITHPRNSVHFARSFLRTIQDELRNHSDRIDLSRSEIARILSDGHQWLAQAELEADGRSAAAWHALCAMWHSQSPRPGWKSLVKTALPAGVLRWLRRRRVAPGGLG